MIAVLAKGNKNSHISRILELVKIIKIERKEDEVREVRRINEIRKERKEDEESGVGRVEKGTGKPIDMGCNVIREHAPIRSASLVNTIQVYAVLRHNLKVYTSSSKNNLLRIPTAQEKCVVNVK